MALKYKLTDLINQSSGAEKIRLLNDANRPYFEELSDIVNFPHYFSNLKIEYGIHRPELKNNKIYISVYHFMEYNSILPQNYDTIAIGGFFSNLTNDFTKCKYYNQDFEINKYDYNFIKENKELFTKFIKN